MSVYQDLQTVLSALLDRTRPALERGVETCPLCRVSLNRATQPEDEQDDPFPHAKDCPWKVAQRVLMYHDARFGERPDLIASVERILTLPHQGTPGVAGGEPLADWRRRMTLAILDAVDLRVRHRPPGA